MKEFEVRELREVYGHDERAINRHSGRYYHLPGKGWFMLNKTLDGQNAAHGPCHHRTCCNPLHLSWKTVAENHADKVRDDTHNRGARHYKAKLTPEKILTIVADKRMQKLIAKDYGVSRSVVSAIKTGGHWNWLTHIKKTKNA